MSTIGGNEDLIREIALAFGELNEKMVYVGGAVVGLYADVPASSKVRPTKDIDVFLEIVSYTQLVRLQEQLARKGFMPEIEQGVMCRFQYKDILVDIMSTQSVGWAPADIWFERGLKTILTHRIKDVDANILHISYFLATKFNAFHDRGEDARTSQDFEDIVYILDNASNLVDEVRNSPADVRVYLKQEFDKLREGDYQEAILGHLGYEEQTERLALINKKIESIIIAG
jgi:predicted nucleotidyltransferase